MFCKPVTAHEPIKSLNYTNLQTTRATGPDGIVPKPVKEIAPFIIEPLLHT